MTDERLGVIERARLTIEGKAKGQKHEENCSAL